LIKKDVFKKLVAMCIVVAFLASELFLPGMEKIAYAQKTKTVHSKSIEVNELYELAGDVNGDENINSIDFAHLRKYLLGITNQFPSVHGEEMADVNCDGSVNSIDFGMMRQFLLGIITKFPNCDISANLVGYYKLDEIAGNTAINQVSKNYGMLNNFDGSQWVNGTVDGGLRFDGINDAVNLADDEYLRAAFSQRTVAMWVKSDDNLSIQELYDEGDSNSGISLRLNGTSLEGIVKSSGNQYTLDYQNFGTCWHHIAFVFDGVKRNCKLYIDGSLADSIYDISFEEVPYHDDDSGLGSIAGDCDSFGNTSGNYFAGVMDDVRIYDCMLAYREVSELYKISTDITLDYALFSADKSSNLTVDASDTLINGNVHTNSDFIYRGNNLDINGLCKSVGDMDVTGTSISIDSVVKKACTIGMPNLTEDIRLMTQENSEEYDTSQQFGDIEVDLSQSIIVNGDVSFDSSLFSGVGYILSTGNITYNAPYISSGIKNKTVMCSENGDITINGSTCVINGVIYAPKGTVQVNVADFTLNGRIIANRIDFQCNNLEVTSSEDDIDLIVNTDISAPILTEPEINIIDEENSIHVLWTTDSKAQSYTLKKGTDPYYLDDVLLDVQQSRYEDVDIQQGTKYYYCVTANYDGFSLQSETISVKHWTDDDGDGLTNTIESNYGTDKNKSDTDGDGINDKSEVDMGTNPLEPDTDGDGIEDGKELDYNANPLLRDTDKDGLVDGYEILYTNTNPDTKDSDNDGIEDAYEDSDADGLTNLEEFFYKSDAADIDTDKDKLPDGEEVNIYGTDPINPDSDTDGIKDGDELELGFIATNPDSDNDSILDGEEITTVIADVYQDLELSSTDNLAIPQVLVTLKAGFAGSLMIEKDDTVSAINENNAIVGLPVDITCDGTIEQATISFNIDDSLLTESSLDQFSIYWYDKNDNCVKPMTTQRDYAGNILSTVTDHFSTYFVMDNDKKVQELGISGDEIINNVNGVADIAFVLDTTGSMDEEIMSVKNYISNFVDSISQEEVYLRLGIVSYNDYIEYRNSSAINHGWFTDVELFKQELSGIDTGDGSHETPVDALEMARRMGFGSNASKFIILITDEGYYINNRYGISNMDEEIQLLQNDNIMTYVITKSQYAVGNDPTNGTDEGYEDLYTLTGGEYANINQDFSVTLDSISNEITDTVNDGYWIVLSDLSLVKLDKDPSLGDTEIDTDNDGIKDIDELIGTTTITIGSETYTCWKFNSNPAKEDTDGDGYIDSIDSSPNQYDLFSNVTITPQEGLAGDMYTIKANTRLNNAVVLFQLNSGKWYTYEEALEIQNFKLDLISTDLATGVSNFNKTLPILDPGPSENNNIRKFRIVGKDELGRIIQSKIYEVIVNESITLSELIDIDTVHSYAVAQISNPLIREAYLEISIPESASTYRNTKVEGYISDVGVYYFDINKSELGNGTFELTACGIDENGNKIAASNKLLLSVKGQKIAKPVFLIKGGHYDDNITVSIGNAIDDGMIYYTTDDTDPYDADEKRMVSSAILYETSEKIAVTSNVTIKARVFYGNNVSELVEEVYYIDGTNSILRRFGLNPLDGLLCNGEIYTYSELLNERPLIGVPASGTSSLKDKPNKHGMHSKGVRVWLLQLIYRNLGFNISNSVLGTYDSWETIASTRTLMALYNLGWREGTGSDSDVGPTMWEKIISTMTAFGNMDVATKDECKAEFGNFQKLKIEQALRWEEEEKARAKKLKEELENAQIDEIIPSEDEYTDFMPRAMVTSIADGQYVKLGNSISVAVNGNMYCQDMKVFVYRPIYNGSTEYIYDTFYIDGNEGVVEVTAEVEGEYNIFVLATNGIDIGTESAPISFTAAYNDDSTLLSCTGYFFLGMSDAVVEGVKGIYEFVKNPGEVVEGVQFLYKGISQPDSMEGKMLYTMFEDFVLQLHDSYLYMDKNEKARLVGRLCGEVILGVIGTKGVDKVLKASKALVASGKFAKVIEVMGVSAKAADEMTGLLLKVIQATEEMILYLKSVPTKIIDKAIEIVDEGKQIVIKLKDGMVVILEKLTLKGEGVADDIIECLGKWCFTGEVVVLTGNGYKRIDEIQEGELVLSQNIDTKEKSLKRVVKVYSGEAYTLVNLKVGSETINTTPLHLFYTAEGEWKEAINLKVGDRIVKSDGSVQQVADKVIQYFETPRRVYNLNVEDNHTYFVSSEDLLVHNTSKCTGEMLKALANLFAKFDDFKIATDLGNMDRIAKEIYGEIDSIKYVNGKRQMITKQGEIIKETSDLKRVFDNIQDLDFKTEISNLLDNMPELTGTNREKLLSVINNTSLRDPIEQLYRKTASIGDGGSASALRREAINGIEMFERNHLDKCVNRLNQIKGIISSESLSLIERDVAEALISDLENAISLVN